MNTLKRLFPIPNFCKANKYIFSSALTFVSLLITPTLAHAETATVQAFADAYTSACNQGAITKSFGTKNELLVNYCNDSLVKFDLSELGGRVLSAELIFNVKKIDFSGLMGMKKITSNWNETVTAVSRPTIDNSSTELVEINSGASVVSYDITSIAQDWVDNPLSNFGLALFPQNTGTGQQDAFEGAFYSSESGNGLIIKIETDGGPPPPTEAEAMSIQSVDVDYNTGVVTINGVNFTNGAEPYLLLGQMPLELSNHSDVQIQTSLPNAIPVGNYRLTIITGSAPGQLHGFDLTLGAVGPRGPMGFTGSQGIQGETGAIGPQGNVGQTGSQGPIGPQGQPGATGSQGEIGFQGPAGIQGDAGETGSQGEIGPQGLTGSQGETGLQGSAGTQGDIGETGSQGEIGPQGQSNVQVYSVLGNQVLLTHGLTNPQYTDYFLYAYCNPGDSVTGGGFWLWEGNDSENYTILESSVTGLFTYPDSFDPILNSPAGGWKVKVRYSGNWVTILSATVQCLSTTP